MALPRNFNLNELPPAEDVDEVPTPAPEHHIILKGVTYTLPEGWVLRTTIRQRGQTAGRPDREYTGPNGVKVRSLKQLKRNLQILGQIWDQAPPGFY